MLHGNDRLSGENLFGMAEILACERGSPRRSRYYTYIVSSCIADITYAVSMSIQIADMKP